MTLARAQNRVPLTINSPWETISGFNLTGREKRKEARDETSGNARGNAVYPKTQTWKPM